MDKKAVLVVSFGTSHNDTRSKTIDVIESRLAAAFPEYDLFRAFSSPTIIKKLYMRDGVRTDDIDGAMGKLSAAGYDEVICQPTYVINGFEYADMRSTVEKYRNNRMTVKIGEPLLTGSGDYEELIACLAQGMEPQKTYVFVGHGSGHPADSAYAALDYRLKANGYTNAFVGTIEGYPDIDTVLKTLQYGSASKTVVLSPLMMVAGDHAKNDLAGNGEASWLCVLTEAGYRVELNLRGLGEYQTVSELLIGHARHAAAI